MKYNESDAGLRRIPVYLKDASGDPVPGLALAGSEIQVSLSGGAFVNGEGVWIERSAGLYYYEATQAESVTDSFVTVKVVDSSLVAKPYVFSVDIGDRIEVDELIAEARRVPIYMVDSSGNPVTGLTLSDVELAENGFDFAAAVNAPATEIGSGAYYYELDATEVTLEGVSTLKVEHASANTYVYAFDMIPSTDDTEEPAPTPIPATAFEIGDPEAIDHIEEALARLCEQFKSEEEDE